MDNPQHSLDDALVEKVARAIAGVCFETGWDDLAEDTRACFFPYARAALEAAGVAELREENERLRKLLNTPEVEDFTKAVPLEAAHQRERWGSEHDAGKTPFDWFWLVGYLAQKAATSAVAGDTEKAKHHTISTAAALANWHLALSGTDTRMRPGIDPVERKVA